MKVTIIIPTHNREANIRCVLASLANQTPSLQEQNVDVIVVDDRSTDRTKEAVFYAIENKGIPCKYLYNPPGKTDWNASIPRNMGARLTTDDTDLLWFLDSDVILPPDAVQKTIEAYGKGKKRVLIGSYHWLQAQDISAQDVVYRFTDIVAGALPKKNVNHPLVNQKDMRMVSFDKAQTSQEEFYSFTDSLACFGGYLLVPRDLFFKAGGYDETIGAGCEDGDFGITLYEIGVRFSYLKETCGYHIPHNWPKGRDHATILENVRKLDIKHNTNMIHESGKAYRKWGIDWEPDPSWYNNDPEILKQWKKEWNQDKMEFMFKVNKV